MPNIIYRPKAVAKPEPTPRERDMQVVLDTLAYLRLRSGSWRHGRAA